MISARCIITTASTAPASPSHAYLGASRSVRVLPVRIENAVDSAPNVIEASISINPALPSARLRLAAIIRRPRGRRAASASASAMRSGFAAS